MTRPDSWQQEEAAEPAGPGESHRPGPRTDTWIMLAAVAAPIAVAAALIPWRHHLDTADNALFLVVVIVAVASTGRRLAAAVAAIVSALSFDFFLTRPYLSFRITRHSDLITEILLVVVGLAVGELAARGRRHRDAAWQGRHEMALLHSVTELAATGQDPQVVVAVAANELEELLTLRGCRFTAHDIAGTTARVTPRRRGSRRKRDLVHRGPRAPDPECRPPGEEWRVAARPLPPHANARETGVRRSAPGGGGNSRSGGRSPGRGRIA